ncbi:DivIVA domain-containing protein [Nocardia yamanashiensis]|uniref:DivIVA domain-containing protein n=1 Tax=Nocardia yamanashiensis TaxID=209247 RepID=UPI0038CDC7E3
MLTLLLYVLIVGLVAALLFLLASALFGRSEELGPLPEGTTATVLPVAGISGSDVRALRFQQVFRGYKAGEVDWALARLAGRIDELENELAETRAYVAATAPERPLAASNLTAPNPDGSGAAPSPAEPSPPDGAGNGATGATTPPPRRVPGATPLPRVLPGDPAAADTPGAGSGSATPVAGTVATEDAGSAPGGTGEGPAGERNGEAEAR